MTREETIHELGEWLEQMIQHGVPSHSAKRKALATAIALLSAETHDKRTETHGVCSDLISRADAIKAVHKYFVEAFNNEPHEIDEDGDDVFTDMKSVNALLHHNKYVSKALKALPSADAVHGEWEHWGSPFSDESEVIDTIVCSVCGARFIEPKDEPKGEYNFCPNCGAKMDGERREP